MISKLPFLVTFVAHVFIMPIVFGYQYQNPRRCNTLHSRCPISNRIKCSSGPSESGSIFKSPETIQVMMIEVAKSIESVKQKGFKLALVDIPIPVTGGTELDDWPGGIKQKYSTIYPMLKVTMSALNFTSSMIDRRDYLGEFGEDDAIGLWNNPENHITICCFPTPDSIPIIQKYVKAVAGETKNADQNEANSDSIFVIVNQQFFLDPLSRGNSKEFLASAEVAYQLVSLNMRGPGALPVRGVLYRQYPFMFKAARRLDNGGYVTLMCYEKKPEQETLEKLYFEDSQLRDKELSLFERLRRQVPNF